MCVSFRPLVSAILASSLLSFSVMAQPPVSTEAQNQAPEAVDYPELPGFKSEKEMVGYMVGLTIARNLQNIKSDIDAAAVARALQDSLSGKSLLMNDQQAAQVGQVFNQRLQTRQQAEFLALAQKNKAEGEAFLAANKQKKSIRTTASGLQYRVDRQGAGAKPTAANVVRVDYRGTLLDGTEFDSSYKRGEPAEFPLNGVIQGWIEGVALMPVGSKYSFWIPGDLAYGAQGRDSIPPNATLFFEIELKDIVK